MKEGFIRTQKTARYFTLGELGPQTTEVWIVLHGYAQLAADFLAPFDCINAPHRFIVAPEGLNKFYARGFGGKPAATWMTSEDRRNEIADYLQYLDTLYESLGFRATSGKFFLLGFSQGVVTATRWLQHTSFRVDELIIYAGEIASELQDPLSPKLSSLPITYITGTKDKLISPEKQATVFSMMEKLNAKVIRFDGGHEVKEEVLKLLV
jgi:predicted esterase